MLGDGDFEQKVGVDVDGWEHLVGTIDGWLAGDDGFVICVGCNAWRTRICIFVMRTNVACCGDYGARERTKCDFKPINIWPCFLGSAAEAELRYECLLIEFLGFYCPKRFH